MNWESFFWGAFVGGVLVAAVLFVLMISSGARQIRDLHQAEDAAYERGFHRGWAERAMKGRMAVYPSATRVSEMAKSDATQRVPTGEEVGA